LGSQTENVAAVPSVQRVQLSSNSSRAECSLGPDGQEMADLLIFLEEWEWARQGMIEELSRA
jgi:hypothetical protein